MPGHLQFVNGYDKRFTQHALEWTDLHPDNTRQYYDPEEQKTALPPSWPPNFVLLAPEQQVGTVAIKVALHTFGSPAPRPIALKLLLHIPDLETSVWRSFPVPTQC